MGTYWILKNVKLQIEFKKYKLALITMAPKKFFSKEQLVMLDFFGLFGQKYLEKTCKTSLNHYRMLSYTKLYFCSGSNIDPSYCTTDPLSYIYTEQLI